MKTFTCIDMLGFGGRKIKVTCDGKYVATFAPASDLGGYAWGVFVAGVAVSGDRLTLQKAGEVTVIVGTVAELDDAPMTYAAAVAVSMMDSSDTSCAAD